MKFCCVFYGNSKLFSTRPNTNDQPSTKKPKTEKKKKIKEENNLIPIVPANPPITPSENENPNEIVEQKQLSYSEVIQEANKLLAADEPMTPNNNPSSSAPVSLTNPATTRLTKPIATVSPLHTSKNNHNRVLEKPDEDQLIDLSKSNVISYERKRRRIYHIFYYGFSNLGLRFQSNQKQKNVRDKTLLRQLERKFLDIQINPPMMKELIFRNQ